MIFQFRYKTEHVLQRLMLVAGLALLFLNPVNSFAQNGPSREYSLKAIFLYNFTQFVEWPPQVFQNASDPFVIGILGEDPFKSYIDKTVAGEQVKGHPIRVERYKGLHEIRNCHMLFISGKEAGRLKDILNLVQRKNILTVSEIPDFANKGGMIRLMTRENKIRLQINPSAAKSSELNISSKLLRLADIVGT